jgi:DNA-binding MarR family transcriptional regulator
MAFLIGADRTDFVTLKQHLQTTDGNLSVHLRKLEDAGYVEIDKSFQDRKPRTEIRLTSKGRKAFVKYLDSLSKLIS